MIKDWLTRTFNKPTWCEESIFKTSVRNTGTTYIELVASLVAGAAFGAAIYSASQPEKETQINPNNRHCITVEEPKPGMTLD